MVASVILVEATPRRASDGSAVPVRLAGGGSLLPYRYGNQGWRAGLSLPSNSASSLDFDGEQLGGGGVAQALELQWSPGTSAALAELAQLYWADAAITVRIGPEGSALPPIDTQGLVLETAVDDGGLRIAMADAAVDLKRALLTDRFAGTGGIEGPAEWEGRIKSRSWGRCFNVLGQIIDKANDIVCFGDPRRPWQAFDQVRDRGDPAASGDLTLLAWQGSVEATFTALQQAVATEGGGVLCPSIACVKWWTAPSGDLHADVRGETDGGYVETAPEIAARIIAARSTLVVSPAALAETVAARPATFGWRVESDSTTAAAELSDMLAGVSLSWLISHGTIEFRRWEWLPSTRTARSESVKTSKVYKPVATRTLGYRRNWSPMARADLAAIVLASDIAYADGTSIEALKPATIAATAGAPAGTTVGGTVAADGTVSGGRAAEQVVSDLDITAAGYISLALRQDDAQTVLDATRFVEGQPIGTFLLAFKNAQQTATEALTSDLTAIGVRTSTGTGFILNLDTVHITPDETLAERFTQIGAANAETSAHVTTLASALVNPDGTAIAAYSLAVKAGNVITGFKATSDGSTGSFAILASSFSIVDDSTGTAVVPFSVTGNAVYAPNLIAGIITYDSLVQRFTDVGQQNLDPAGWYQVLPGGLIMQGGRYRGSIGSETTFAVTFPRPFPNQVLATGAMGFLATFSNVRDLWMQNVGEPTKTTATYATQAATNNEQHLDGFDWWAWGR